MKSRLFPRLITAICCLAIFWACNAQQNTISEETPADITLNVTGAGAGTVYLISSYADRRYRIDSVTVAAGEAVNFQRDIPYPNGFYVAYYADKTAVQFLLDADQEFTLTGTKDDLIASTVEGSTANELFYKSLKFESDQQTDFNEVGARLQSQTPGTPEYLAAKKEQEDLVDERKAFLKDIFDKHPDNFFVNFKKAGQNPDLRTDLTLPDGSPDNDARVEAYRNEFWDNVDFSDTSLMYTPVINNKLTRYFTQLTPQRAEAIIKSADQLMARVQDAPKFYQFFANWITLKYEPGNTTLMDGEAVYVNMIQKYFTKEKAFWTDSMTVFGLQQRAGEMAPSVTGVKGPNITVPDVNGTPRTLYDMEEPYLIVFMYNPTCEHCIAETPKLIDYLKTRNDIGVFAVALDTEAAAWKKFIQDFGTQDWTNVYDPTSRSIYKTYYVDHTPELYLLNRDRVIIGKNLKASQIADVIARDQG